MKRQDSQSRKNETKQNTKNPHPDVSWKTGDLQCKPSPVVRLAAAAGHTERCCAIHILDLNDAFSRKNKLV